MRATVTAFSHMSGKNQWMRDLFFWEQLFGDIILAKIFLYRNIRES
jgi:hypothetical protein